jgi:general secretion pathway protein D
LATPQILALDNTEASFEVGESVPVTEQTIANNQTQVSVRQQKAGLTLKITPQINKITRFVKLKIDQKIEEFQARANTSAAGGLATTNRAAITTVVVRDRDTIAMGGLMRDQTIESVSKVPLLGDIPIFGWLFKNTTKTMSKVNLLFFLTPQIMDDYQKDTAKLVKEKLERRASHLKINNASEDPYANNVKTIYEKAKKQEKGPLFSEEAANRYKSEETIQKKKIKEEEELEEEFEESFEQDIDGESAMKRSQKSGVKGQTTFSAPTYRKILQKIKLKKSATKK